MAVSLLQLSCTNWLVRQECKEINWYQHGFDVAMEGRRLSGDDRAEKCRRADYDVPEQQIDLGFKAGMSNYCKPEIVYATGKKGEYFNTELCDPGQATTLALRHKEGVYQYCAVDNGYAAGASGRKYQNICPGGMERPFLKEYHRGRKKYLAAVIADSKMQIAHMDRQILDVEHQRANLSFQYGMLPGPRDITERTYTSAGTTEQTRTEDPAAMERQRIRNDINSANAQIQNLKNQQEALRKKISEFQIELETIE